VTTSKRSWWMSKASRLSWPHRHLSSGRSRVQYAFLDRSEIVADAPYGYPAEPLVDPENADPSSPLWTIETSMHSIVRGGNYRCQLTCGRSAARTFYLDLGNPEQIPWVMGFRIAATIAGRTRVQQSTWAETKNAAAK